MNWILVIVLIVLVLFISTKFKEIGAHTKLTALILFLLFFVGTIAYVWFVARPDLTTYQGFLNLGKAYYSWLGSIFHGMGSVTGYAIKQDWGVSNITASP